MSWTGVYKFLVYTGGCA